MNDLQLWHRLHDEALGEDLPALLDVLRRLATVHPTRRWPTFARVSRWVTHPDPKVRTAAGRVLAGASGVTAWKALAHALDDGAPEVREAALDALARAAGTDLSRWALAVVHPDPTVRAGASVRMKGVDPLLSAALLADPDLRGAALQRLAAPPVSASTFDRLVEHLAAGHLDEVEAATVLAGMDVRAELPTLCHRGAGPRDLTALETTRPEALEAWVRGPDGTAPAGIDAFVRVLCEGIAGGATAACEASAGLLEQVALAPSGPMLRQLAASVVLRAAGGRPVPGTLLALAALLIPAVLGVDAVPAEVRRAALGALARAGRGLEATAPLRALGERPVWRGDDGAVDLVAVAGAVQLCGPEAMEQILDELGLDGLIEALLDAPEAAGPLLGVEHRGGPLHQSWGAILEGLIARAVTDPRASTVVGMLWIRRPGASLRTVPTSSVPGLLAVLSVVDAAVERGRLGETGVRLLARRVAAVPPPLARAKVVEFLLSRPVDAAFSSAVLLALTEILGGEDLAALPESVLLGLIARDAEVVTMSWEVQHQLAHALEGRAGAALRVWAQAVLPSTPPTRRHEAWTFEEGGLCRRDVAWIQSCSTAELDDALAPALAASVTGVVAALAHRRPEPSAAAVAALLMCADPVEDALAAALDWGLETPSVLQEVERLLVRVASHRADVGRLAGAVLFRWDKPRGAFVAWAVPDAETFASTVAWSLDLRSRSLRAAIWRALRHHLGILRHRAPTELRALGIDGLAVEAVVAALEDRGAPHRRGVAYPADGEDLETVRIEAARILERFAVVRGLAVWRDRVRALRGELPPEAQRAISAWLHLGGARVSAVTSVATGRETDVDADAAIAGDDPAPLIGLCLQARRDLAELGTLRLVELEAWRAVVVALLDPEGPHPDVVSQALPELPAGPWLGALRAAVSDPACSVAVRLFVGLGLIERGEDALAGAVLELAAHPGATFLRLDHVARLVRAVADVRRCAGYLVRAPAFPAHAWALDQVDPTWPDEDAVPVLRAFLDRSDGVAEDLRLDAACDLRERGDPYGAPVVVCDAMRDAGRGRRLKAARTWARGWPAPVVAELTRAALFAGEELASARNLVEGLLMGGVAREGTELGCTEILAHAASPALQRRALDGLPSGPARTATARRLAHLFLWGRDQAMKLLGRRFAIRYLVGEELGLTRLEHAAVYVNPLPLLRGERHGEAIVRGLMVHELGHHVYNGDADGRRVWAEAQRAGLSRLHNLVCDEHLERNLRRVDAAYGDDLKRLGAWAFLHARRTLPALDLLRQLGPGALSILSGTRLMPARERGQVEVPLGDLFRALEARGSSFSRFFRALRMGLGDRWGDPRVRAALDLFDKSFRELDNPGLWAVTRRLAELFGDDTAILDLADVHAVAAGAEGDDPVHGQGVTDAEIEREVQRIEGDRDGLPGGTTTGPPRGRPRDVVNTGSDEVFRVIEHVERLVVDPAAHAALAREVARDARHMRQALERLGLRHRWVGPRSRGSRLDRARLPGAAVRRDPRVLRSRVPESHADLFLGVVVDCSGSMQGERMERARRMAALLAEAARGLGGVDLRLFGFTDDTIHDAGDADRCAAHALEAGGGNNDAAGLWHAATHALHSSRSARLLVMISDGLPTDCTVEALRALVHRLERRHHLHCAQIAVAPLAEKCFPTYLEVTDDQTGAAVRHFGQLVTDLVASTLRG